MKVNRLTGDVTVKVVDHGLWRSHQPKDAGATWCRVADLKPNADGFKFTADWFGCYARDPVNEIVYASSMGNPVFKLAPGK